MFTGTFHNVAKQDLSVSISCVLILCRAKCHHDTIFQLQKSVSTLFKLSLDFSLLMTKKAQHLIRCKLRTNVFTQSALIHIFSEFSYFNLKFGI